MTTAFQKRHKALAKFFRVSGVFAILFCFPGCWASSQDDVMSRLPKGIVVEETIFFQSESWCVFAEFSTANESTLPNSDVEDSLRNLEAMIKEGQTKSHLDTSYTFPTGGFAYFDGWSLEGIAGTLKENGDYGLGSRIMDQFYFAVECMRPTDYPTQENRKSEFLDRVSDKSGVVIISEERPHSIMAYFPKDNRLLYFGP